MSTSADNTSNSNAYWIPLLKEDNWLPWKRRVEAILNDKGLQEYVTGKTPKPQPSNDPANRAAREAEISAWGEKDLKAQNIVVLSLGDSQMVHIAGAETARAMWEQLRTVKKQRGQHGILVLCRRFYRMQAKEEDNISSHITQLRQIQEQLHLMGKVVSDEDFRLILATSLPESWDSFLSSYFGAVGGNVGAEGADNVRPQLTSQELIAIILDENRRRHERGERGQSSDQAMVAKGKKRPFGEYKKCSICGKPGHLGNECQHRDKVKCMNCGKFGHKATDCWAKGGSKAGQGPLMKRQKTERAYEAHEVESKEDEAKIAYNNDSDTVSLGSDGEIASFYEWFADSGTTSHITNCREVFATYQALEDHAITGIRLQPTQALGRGTVDVESKVGDRKVKFRLHSVLYALTAPNSLLSITRLDDAGGRVLMVYIKNRSPTQALNGATPEEKWNGMKPNISYLQEFGSPVWVLTEDATLSKLAPRANKYIFVGYMDGPKAIKYYDAHTRQIKISRNFQFSSNFPDHLPGNAPHVPQEQIGSDVPILIAQCEGEQNIFPGTLPSNVSDVPHAERRPEVPNLTTTADVRREGELGTSAPQSPAKNSRKCKQDDDPDQREESGTDAPSQLRRTRRKTVRHDYRLMHDPEADEDLDNDPDKSNAELVYIAMSTHGNADADEPKTLSDAKRSLKWPKWEQAVQTELNQLQGMETWELVEPPKDRKPVGNKWVLVKKTNKEGEIIKYKARLVVKGYSQIPGMDYTETFMPVVHLETIRAILGLAAILDWEIGQMDVKGAYLNGTLKEEVYMRQPKGYSDGTYHVCKLKKTLYGLKQSGREWNIVLNRKLLDAGFKRLFSDPCAYIWIKGDKIEIVTVWVDDLLIFTNDCALMDQLKRELRNMFEVTDLGEPRKIVGIEIERDRSKRTIKISQTKYIESILHKNGLTNANTVGMPLDPNTVLEKEEPETDDECDRDNGYALLIGSLMYVAIATRPDIAHAVQRLSSFTANPGMAHWTAAKRILHYLSGMRELGIIYGPIADVKPEDQSIFVGYSDTDYVNDIRDRKSISGYLFKLGNGTITWSSKKQTTVASSTTEAEYMASAEAAKEVVWLRTLFKEIGFEQQDPTILFEDNTAAISIARDPQFHAKSKHFDVKHHYVREKLRDKYIDIHYCPTEDMIADILTKSLPKPRHEKLTKKLGMPIGLRGSVGK
ncbi:hypothetical protein SCP_0213570 [Sparassis crispa]|uniref:CCHC-type domain-containing protein n=1 Tax=Sparassis crispa TaxID=139825 RepID=A0A401GD97_9APHY|nr:hypothetical protein SCP_0213570 [Sparassis crispa]GBE80154.1 hypothetical protein SCP_0213570 [Sparassis crispa]